MPFAPLTTLLTFFDQMEVSDLVPDFPDVFARAQRDWGAFKAGVRAGVVPEDVRQRVVEWYSDFPRLWETIRPNWTEPEASGVYSQRKIDFAKKVDAWVATLRVESRPGGLGLAVVVIAGIVILATAGVAGALWAVGYVKRQQNISEMIAAVVEGKLPPEVLQDAIEQESQPGLFGDLKDMIGLMVAGGLALMFLPQVLGMRAK